MKKVILVGQNDLVILTGGTGTVKLIKGFYNLNYSISDKMTIVTNTGDDFEFYGLKVAPDTDAVVYSLSNLLDDSKMWGIKEDRFEVLKTLQSVDKGENSVAAWFNLGDKDLAYCLYRTHLMQSGKTLSEVTAHMKETLGINTEIIPMTNDQVTTFFTTKGNETYHFAEFFIRLQSKEPIKEINYVNAAFAKAPAGLVQKILDAKVILLGPSNPITSIGPILAIKEIKKAIIESSAKKVVISPITGNKAFSGPAKIYMEAKNVEASPFGIFDYYKDIADDYYFADSDKEQFEKGLTKRAVENNKQVFFEDIFFPTIEKQVAFAEKFKETYKL